MRNLGVLTLVVGAFFVLSAGNASAVTAASAVKVNGGWTHLGGDPVVPGGVNSRNNLVRLVTSRKGAAAMTYAGLSPDERSATVRAARTGKFRSCYLRYGMKFQRMSFGINGTSVDRNVTFLDPRYRHKPAAAWCMDVRTGNKVLHILVPYKCGNIAVINRTPAPKPGHKVKVTPKPKPKKPVKPAPKPQVVAVCTLNGVPQYTQPPGYIIGPNGVCVAVAVSVPTVNCQDNQTPVTNSQGVVINCINNTNVNTNTNTVNVPVTVIVTPPVVVIVTPPPVVPPVVVVHSCTISATAQKGDPYTAYVTLSTDVTPSSSTFVWGDGTSAGGVTTGIHTYPTPAPGPAGTGATYTISATAKFADGQNVSCGSTQFFVPAPPPSGGTAPPPPPGG